MSKISNCPLCGSDITDNTEMQVAEIFRAYVEDSDTFYSHGGAWGFWADAAESFSRECGRHTVTLIAKSVHFDESQGDDRRPAFLIFDVDGVLLRKDGVADSYGDVTWNGLLRPAKRVEKTVTAYE